MWSALVLSASDEKHSSDIHRGWSAGEVRPGIWQHKRVQPETRDTEESQGKTTSVCLKRYERIAQQVWVICVCAVGYDDKAHQRHGQVQLCYCFNHRWRRGRDWSGEFKFISHPSGLTQPLHHLSLLTSCYWLWLVYPTAGGGRFLCPECQSDWETAGEERNEQETTSGTGKSTHRKMKEKAMCIHASGRLKL